MRSSFRTLSKSKIAFRLIKAAGRKKKKAQNFWIGRRENDIVHSKLTFHFRLLDGQEERSSLIIERGPLPPLVSRAYRKPLLIKYWYRKQKLKERALLRNGQKKKPLLKIFPESKLWDFFNQITFDWISKDTRHFFSPLIGRSVCDGRLLI